MATVIRNVMNSSVEFVQGNQKVLVANKHLPLFSAVISAVSDKPLACFGVRNSKSFITIANSEGYKGHDKIMQCAKDTLGLAEGKRLLVKDGVSYGINGEFRAIADDIVSFVNSSDQFKKKEGKVANTKASGRKAGSSKAKTATAEKSSKIAKFRVDEDNKLVRLTRGKPSPFWMIVEAPETAEGSVLSKDFKVLQEASAKEEKAAKSKGSAKVAKAKGISQDEVAALVASQVSEITKDLTAKVDNLTELLKSLISKVDALTVTQPAKPLTGKAKQSDSEKAKEDAKIAALADISSISEEFGVIVTSL